MGLKECINPLTCIIENVNNLDDMYILKSHVGEATVFRTAESNQQNVEFGGQNDPYMYSVDSPTDPTRSMEDKVESSLDKFFSRPIKIAEREWSTSVDLNFDIDPWSLFFDNPRVNNRITNYNLLRANLHVRIVINGNGFQYGRMLVSYTPLSSWDFLTSNAALVREDLVQASQRPHVFLNPTMSTGGELRLPMFFHRNYISVPDANWNSLGSLYFRTLNSLKHANGATDVVTVSVFAWAEDVSLSMLTSVDTAVLSPQSGEIDEANAKGVVSGPATAISRAAAVMGSIPYIGPFAKATEIGASAVAGMAKIFGYSRPVLTRAPEPYKPTFAGSLALTTTPDTSQKLTVDDKQELSIDPRIAGIGPVDPLNIRSIAQRESYLTTFSWNIGTAPETLLWNSRVSPVLWAESPTAGLPNSPAHHFPACAFAALPFKFWRGTMRFRFQVVASAFHKGRLKIVYDPNHFQGNTYLGFTEYNVNYLKVVDIAEESDFTVEIGNAQDVSYLTHAYPGLDSVTEVYSTSPYLANGPGNGVVGVYVVNELTTPNSTVANNIEINVFVSAGDDFEVSVPDAHFSQFILQPQSGDYRGFLLASQSGTAPETIGNVELDSPHQENVSTIGQSTTGDDHLNGVFIGESIASFRPLLKRFSAWNTISVPKTEPMDICGRFPRFPYYRGYGVGNIDSGNYNYVNTLLLHWVRWAYSGERGSIRYKFIPRGPTTGRDLLQVQRGGYFPATATNETKYKLEYVASPSYDSASPLPGTFTTSVSTARRDLICGYVNGLPRNDPLTGSMGMAIAHGFINQMLEFEMPFYSQIRFVPGKIKNLVEDAFINIDEPWDFRIFVSGTANDSHLTRGVYDIYTATGEDFQVFFFTGLPRLYYEPSPPLV